MLHIPKIDDYWKFVTDDEVKDSIATNFGDYIKSTKQKLHSKLSKGKTLRKVTKLV